MASNDSDNDIFVQEEVVGDVPIHDGSSEKKKTKRGDTLVVRQVQSGSIFWQIKHK